MSRSVSKARRVAAEAGWGGFEGKGSIIGEDDWAFIREISDRFPEREPSIFDRFHSFEKMHPRSRVRNAFIELRQVPREGLKQRGVDVQSVYDHSKNMEVFLRAAFDKGRIQASHKDQRKTIQKAAFHDLTEALITDFTPKDQSRISADEKTRLEDLAAKLLFEAFPDRYQDFQKYKDKKTKWDERVKIADVIEWLADCVVSDIPETQISQEMLRGIFDTLSKYPRSSAKIGWRPAQALWDLSNDAKRLNKLRQLYPDKADFRRAVCQYIIAPGAYTPGA